MGSHKEKKSIVILLAGARKMCSVDAVIAGYKAACLPKAIGLAQLAERC